MSESSATCKPPEAAPHVPPRAGSLWLGRGLCVAASLLWSTSGLFIKTLTRAPALGGDGWSGLQVAGLRSLIAFPLLLALSRPVRLPGRRDMLVAICLAAILIPYALAQTYTSTANAILLQYAAPLYVMALAPFVLRERPRLRDLVACPFLIGGVVLIFFSSDFAGGTLFGNVMGTFEGLTYALLVIALRKWPETGGLCGLAWGNLLAALVALPTAAMLGDGLTMPTAASGAKILFLGLVQIGVAYFLFEWSLRILRAIEASFITMIEPVACPLWAYLAIGEEPAALAMLGGVLIIVTLAGHAAATARAS